MPYRFRRPRVPLAWLLVLALTLTLFASTLKSTAAKSAGNAVEDTEGAAAQAVAPAPTCPVAFSVPATALPAPHTAPPATFAASALLLDLNSGTVLAEKDADTRRPMASTTKIMTALVVLETLPLDETVVVPREAAGVEGSSIYLFEGERVTVRTLLYGLLLSSANDAAVALACRAAGSAEAFAAQMNAKAAALGLADTCFKNPHGLPAEGHYTTARDLARLAAAALADPRFAEIVATRRYEAKQEGTDATRLFLNHNRLLRTYEGTIGVKTGYTAAAGRCLVSAAERDGLRLVAVTLNDRDDWRDHAALFDWAFSEYEGFAPAPLSVSLPVVGGERAVLSLTAAAPPAATLPRDHAAITRTVEAPHFLYGGCRAGDVIGAVVYRMGETELCRLPLVADETVSPVRPRRTFFTRIRDLFSRW